MIAAGTVVERSAAVVGAAVKFGHVGKVIVRRSDTACAVPAAVCPRLMADPVAYRRTVGAVALAMTAIQYCVPRVIASEMVADSSMAAAPLNVPDVTSGLPVGQPFVPLA